MNVRWFQAEAQPGMIVSIFTWKKHTRNSQFGPPASTESYGSSLYLS